MAALLGVLYVVFALATASNASAAFARPSVRQLTGPPGTPFEAEALGGVANDAANNVWVGDGPNHLDRFGPSGTFEKSVELVGNARSPEGFTPPGSLAIDFASEHFYVTGPRTIHSYGPFLEVFDSSGTLVPSAELEFGGFAHVTIDHSTNLLEDPSACTVAGCVVYVTHSREDSPSKGDGQPAGIARLNTKGEAASFTGTGPCIEGNTIVGVPSADGKSCTPFRFEAVQGIAVDDKGDLFVVDRQFEEFKAAVVEYGPDGRYIQAITGAETPGLGESRDEGGFGGQVESVAIDPLSRHLLVSITHTQEGVGPVEGAIDEFDTTSGHYLNQISGIEVEPEPGVRKTLQLKSAYEMTTDALGDVYVVDQQQHVVDEFGPGAFLPSLRIVAADHRTPTGATLNGEVNPEGRTMNKCEFQYVTDTAFGESGFATATAVPCTPAAGAIPPDSTFHKVSAATGALQSGTTYRYRLLASTEGELGGEADSVAAAFTAPHSPTGRALSATNISSTFADLRGTIDPLGAPTTYHFEYDTSPYNKGEGGHGTSVPVPDEPVGSGGPTGSTADAVVQHIGGLAPATVYHFRLVASNVFGSIVSEDEELLTLPEPATGLPDGRAYELVTPPSKPGGSDMFALPPTNGEYANEDSVVSGQAGLDVLLHTHANFGPFPGNEESAYVFSRTTAGWGYTSLASPSLGVQNVDPTVYEPERLSVLGINDNVGSLASEAGTQRQSLIGPAGGPYSSLHADPPNHVAFNGGTVIVGASHDLSHIVLSSGNLNVCPGHRKEVQRHGRMLCEWSGETEVIGGEAKPLLRSLNVNSGGSVLSSCGAAFGTGANAGAHNAIAADGSRVIFTAPDPEAANQGPGCWDGTTLNAPQLYMRLHGKTITLSAPEAGVEEGGKAPTLFPVSYVGAAEDDSRVFFTTNSWLTADHPTLHDSELYECRVSEPVAGAPRCQLTRISAGNSGSPGTASGAAVNTVPVISSNGAAVYFTAYGALAPGSAELENAGVAGHPVNLYRYDTAAAPGSGTSFLTAVSALDYPVQQLACLAPGAPAVVALCPSANWYSTPDGRFLVFAASTNVTRYDSTGPCRVLPDAGGTTDGHCDEIYRYDAARPVSEGVSGVPDNPACVSCNPSGAPPASNSLFGRSADRGPSSGMVTAMSNDGSYVFFDTADALVPQDGNGTLDVYEWHNGRLSLISSGKSAGPSFFLGASADRTSQGTIEGANVFIGTHSTLVSEDVDTSGDVYNARICVSSDPCRTPAGGKTAQCEGDACHPLPNVPLDPTPTSSTFLGVGNVPSIPPPVSKPLTRAQKLARALAACHRGPHNKRRACERRAHKAFGTPKKARARKATDKGHTTNRGEA